MRSRGIQPSIAQPGSAVRVTRAAAGDVPGSLTPAGGGRTLDPHALDDAVPDARGDLVQQSNVVRHNPDAIAAIAMELAIEGRKRRLAAHPN